MDIDPSILSEIVKGCFQLLAAANAKKTGKKEDVSINLSRHLQEVVNWSNKVQFYGMSSGEDTDSATISLTFDTIPRKFRGKTKPTEKLAERSLLSLDENILILGDPGSGKTTTLMRLARHILSNEAADTRDTWQDVQAGSGLGSCISKLHRRSQRRASRSSFSSRQSWQRRRPLLARIVPLDP